ncbi:hypothetical protein N7494_001065 [Penicillium frequentans]|uniref:Uncharacterized protein n=1 Tax=Penicillium frequentans TaxID=3151616 RepID=A0AAD6GLK5_9EURO|nr:hypothetical protein N7494_001065 [Penicillium glabrum]
MMEEAFRLQCLIEECQLLGILAPVDIDEKRMNLHHRHSDFEGNFPSRLSFSIKEREHLKINLLTFRY